MGDTGTTSDALVVFARASRCALPVAHVIETMRPLPVQPAANTPSYVLGLCIVRGAPLPVVDLGALLTPDAIRPPPSARSRFVSVRAGARHAVLAVEAVVGVRSFRLDALHELPPLLRFAPSATITALASVDRDMVAFLDASRVLPDEIWSQA